MSPIETLYILVALETGQLKKGLDDTKEQVKKLESEFQNLGKAGDHVSSSFDHVLKSAIGMFAGFASFHAILSGATGAIQGIREMGQAARELNIDVSALDAWGSAVARLGGSASGFQSSLASLASHFGTTNEIALRTLPRLADAFAKLNPLQAQNYGKSLGLDQSTILLLQQGRREVEATIRQQKELGVVTKDQIESTRKFDAALYDVGRAYQQFYREFAAPIIPYFTTALEWTIKNKELVKDAFMAMSVGVISLSASLISLNPTLALITSGLALMSAGYALLKEDVRAYEEGRDSLTGEYADPIAKNVVKNLALGVQADILLGKGINSVGNILNNTNATNSPSITIGDITIETLANDAVGIATSIKDKIGNALGQLISQVDNGVHK